MRGDLSLGKINCKTSAADVADGERVQHSESDILALNPSLLLVVDSRQVT